MEKKPYTPPTVTDHGKVEAQTQGVVSVAYETFGHRAATEPDHPAN